MRQAIEGYRKIYAHAEKLAQKDCETRGLCIEGFCGLKELDIEGGNIYITYDWQHPVFSNTDFHIESWCIYFTENEFCGEPNELPKTSLTT